jgi:hypothetical protein
MNHLFRVAVLLLPICASSAPAFAQDSGARVAEILRRAFGEGETNIAAGGSVGYRFTPHVGFELEALALPDLELDATRGDGRGVVFLLELRRRVSQPRSMAPALRIGGGGVANVSSSSRLALPVVSTAVPAECAPIRDSIRAARSRAANGPQWPLPRWSASIADAIRGPRLSQTGVALSVGGGVDFTLWHGFAVGPTISYLKLFGKTATWT